MIYKDRVYGPIEINEQILLELIASPSLQRLKDIDQAGYSEPFFPGTGHARFEHSLGVMILLKKFGADLEEQVAGLIHDVSHSVFSHSIDYILEEGSEKKHDHQDNIFSDFVRNSEIPKIVEKYNIDLDYILEEANFPLKEKELPDLCADRIDYSLRETLTYGTGDSRLVKLFLDNLVANNNSWIFKNFETAQKFADNFNILNSKFYAGSRTALMFRTAGDCLKYALNKGYITKDDLYTTDSQVLEKIKKELSADERLKLFYDRMHNKKKINNNPENFDVEVYCKSRVVNPLCFNRGKLMRISDINPAWKKVFKTEQKPKKYFLKFEE